MASRPGKGTSAGTGPIRYTRYRRVNPVNCDDCMAAYLTEVNPPRSRPATHERKQAGAKTLLLCHEHTQIRKQAEAR
ncbi:MAG: hypothetical protein ACRDP6_37200 [Actinoallomurus sp.]